MVWMGFSCILYTNTCLVGHYWDFKEWYYEMSKFLLDVKAYDDDYNDDAMAKAIPQLFSENCWAKNKQNT